ncbi:MAG: glycosyltransferase, partial [Cyclobacteriaceae bacterium]
MKITFFFRKRKSGYNSIEEVFNTIIPIIGSSHQTNRITAPCQSTILGVIPNWLYTFWRRADIIHITGDAHYLGLFSKSPLVITVHDLASIFRSKSILNTFKKWLWVNGPLKRAAQVVAISENTRNEISQMLPEVDHKTTVIPNPISSLFKFSPKKSMNETPIILHIGTATHKNLVKVINAIADQKVELIILGMLSSPQKQLLDETFMAYQNFSGLTYEEVYQLYLKADIISFPSEYEGFGMPIIE